MSVLVTDAGFKHSLAIIRSLGDKKLDVGAVDTKKWNSGFLSRYVGNRCICPDPVKDNQFIECIFKIIKKDNYDVLLPVSDISCKAVSKYKSKLEEFIKVPVAEYESMLLALDKIRTMKFAEEQGVNIPRTIYPTTLSEVEELSKNFTYPLVIKAPGGAGSSGVMYAKSKKELISKYPQLIIDTTFPMIQEYIPGKAQGFFALFNHGKPRAIFMHERIREYPITGGPSTMAKSIYTDSLKRDGLKILKALNWHGVAMVEFKLDSRDNKLKLMEVNPKFWGSLELAMASGVDFPYLTYKMALDGDIKPIMKYEVGIKFRWIFPGEILYLLSAEDKNQALKEFIKFGRNNTKYDLRMTDPFPNLFQGALTVRDVIRLLRNKYFTQHNLRGE